MMEIISTVCYWPLTNWYFQSNIPDEYCSKHSFYLSYRDNSYSKMQLLNLSTTFVSGIVFYSYKKVLKNCTEVQACVKKRRRENSSNFNRLYHSCINRYAFMVHIIRMLHFLAFMWYTTVVYTLCSCWENQIWNNM